jgi:hypothetical protein
MVEGGRELEEVLEPGREVDPPPQPRSRPYRDCYAPLVFFIVNRFSTSMALQYRAQGA